MTPEHPDIMKALPFHHKDPFDRMIISQGIMSRFKEEILSAFHKEVLFTSHTLHEMNLPERMITKQEVKETVLYGEIIEVPGRYTGTQLSVHADIQS